MRTFGSGVMRIRDTCESTHLAFMDEALVEAKKALGEQEVPVGAVVVGASGEVIARAYNYTESGACQAEHAEMRAIRQACSIIGNWRLSGCRLYVTLEPCLMCFGLITLSRISTVFYGATSPLFGCGLDNEESFPVYKKSLLIQGGLRAEESVSLLRIFFEKRRSVKGRV